MAITDYSKYVIEEEEDEVTGASTATDYSKYVVEDSGSAAVSTATDYSKYVVNDDGTSPSRRGSSISAFESGVERAKGAFGSFAGEYVPDLIGEENVPTGVIQWGQQAAAESEAALANYRSTYGGNITEEDWQDMLPSIMEKAQENVALTGAIMTSSVVAGAVALAGAPAWAAGLFTAGSLAMFPPIIDEVFKEQASIEGISTKDMTQKQKNQAWWDGIENFGIEMANPVRWFKITKGAPLPKTNDELAEYIKNTDPTKLAEQMKIMAKESGKSALVEGGTEVVQDVNIAAGTSKGIGAKDPGEYLTSGLVGATIGGAAGTVPGISEARKGNNLLKKGTRYLDDLDVQAKEQAGIDYNSQFQELSKSAEGDFSPIFDVEPELYNLPKKDPTQLQNLWTGASKYMLNKSTDEFNAAFDKAKTGRDVNLATRRLFGKFGEVESGSGKTGFAASFNTERHTQTGKATKEFNIIHSRWGKSIPGLGALGMGVPQPIDNYFRALLTGKDIALHEAALPTEYVSKIGEMKRDAKVLAKELENSRLAANREGLDIKRRKNYLPREYDKTTIKNDKAGFIKTLKEDVGITATETKTIDEVAEEMYYKFLDGKDPKIMTSEQIRNDSNASKGQGKRGFEKQRKDVFDKINPKFLEDSVFTTLQTYLINAATRTASVKVFGDKGKTLHKDVNEALKRKLIDKGMADTIWKMYDAEHHQYNRPETPVQETMNKAQKAATTAAAIRFLGLAPISSLTEPFWGMGRVGTINMLKSAPALAGHALIGMKSMLYSGGVGTAATMSYGKQVINVLGMATNPRESEKMSKMYGGDKNVYLNVWFRTLGGGFLTQYTNFVRVWTATAALKMIQSHANKINSLKGRKLSAWKNELKENGMSINDFKQITRIGKGKIDILDDTFLDTRFTKEDGTNISVRDVMLPWVRKITTDIALEPGVGNRPLWMSNPDMQLISQLKSFPIMFGNSVMKRTMRQLNPKVCTPNVVGAVGAIGAAATALAVASLAMAIKDMIRGVDKERGVIDTVSAVGIPWVGSGSIAEAGGIPAFAVADNFASAIFGDLFGDGDGGKTAEETYDFLLRTILGAIVAENADDE